VYYCRWFELGVKVLSLWGLIFFSDEGILVRKIPFFCGIWVMACVAGMAVQAQTAKAIYTEPSQLLEKRVDALVGSMTLEEKVAQTQNHATAIPRLGVPEYDYWSEGLHGIARSGYATLFPQAVGLAATWDTPLIHDVSTVISTEARAKFNQAMHDDVHSIFFGLTIWSPNIISSAIRAGDAGRRRMAKTHISPAALGGLCKGPAGYRSGVLPGYCDAEAFCRA